MGGCWRPLGVSYRGYPMPWADYTESAAEVRGRDDGLGRTIDRPGPGETVETVQLPPYPARGSQAAPGYLVQARAAAAAEIARIEAAWLGLQGDLAAQLAGLRGDRRDLPPRPKIDQYRRVPAGLNLMLYLCIALIAGAAEFVMLFQVFQVAGKESNLLMSLLLPAGLAVVLPLAAHFVGEDWRTLESRDARPAARGAARRRMIIVIAIIAAAQLGVALFRFVKFGGKLRQTTTMAGLIVPSWAWILTFLAFQAALFVFMALAARRLPSEEQSGYRAAVRAVDALEQRATGLNRQWETGYQARRGEARQVSERLEGVYGAYWAANDATRSEPFGTYLVPPPLGLPSSLERSDPPEFDVDLEPQSQDAAAPGPAQPTPQTPGPTPVVPDEPTETTPPADVQQPAGGQEELVPEIT
jgi:hypothetical protein